MAIKAGQVVHKGNNTFLVDGLQSVGPGSLNINTERVTEVGNYKAVGQIRDTPDLSFAMESFDCTTEIENLITGGVGDFSTGVNLATCRPLDVVSQIKPGANDDTPFAIVETVALPFLYTESVNYRFGVSETATQTFNLKGDTIFYGKGVSYVETTPASGSAAQAIATAHAAYKSNRSDARRVLSVTVGDIRIQLGSEYTETYGSITSGAAVTTIHIIKAHEAGTPIRIVYASPVALDILQSEHPTVTVKPRALRRQDIDVYLGGYDPDDVAGSLVNKLVSVQSVNIDWRVTLQRDLELGSSFSSSADFEVPDTTGTLTVLPRDAAALHALLMQSQDVVDDHLVLDAETSTPIVLDVVLRRPGTAEVLKRLHVPDARLTLPGYTARVLTKTPFDVPFTSDSGDLIVFDGQGVSA